MQAGNDDPAHHNARLSAAPILFSGPAALDANALEHAGTNTCIIVEWPGCCEKPPCTSSRRSPIVTIS